MIRGRTIQPIRMGRNAKAKRKDRYVDDPCVHLFYNILLLAVKEARYKNDKQRRDAFDFLVSEGGRDLLMVFGIDPDAAIGALQGSG